ncbi:MAG: helix-turn-helix domain-containing protein [Clostridiales bacterium]|nr:helix-turn-helix domain-containing protein [Clostridiales bacterium]
MKQYMLNQSEFAKFLDVPITTYSQWERGTSNPTLETALILSIKLNINISDIWSYEK